MGKFEESWDVCKAQFKVEGAVEDRDLLTWRIPNGESVVDVAQRVQNFLQNLKQQVVKLPQQNVTVFLIHYSRLLVIHWKEHPNICLKDSHRQLSYSLACN